MLSASSFSSTPSSAFSATGSPDTLTPSSQYLPYQKDILNELIETEQNYLDTLYIIDSRLASVWMKQTMTNAPDFSKLLKHINEIYKVNKSFYAKLLRITQSPQVDQEFNKELISWVEDLEVPYTDYCRSYIPNLNRRTDILSNSFISSLLQDLSKGSFETSLESLFNAPLQQLKYYKNLYSRLLKSIVSDRLLTSADKKLNVVLSMSQRANRQNEPLHIQTGFESDLKTFESQVDCSRTMNFFGGTCIDYKQFRISNPGSELVKRDTFGLVAKQNGSTVRVHLVLTTEVLVICRELKAQSYSLMFPPVPIGDIVVRADSIERSLVDEYLIQFSILNKTNLIFRADSKETRNTWVGADQNSPQHVLQSPRPLNEVAQKMMMLGAKARNTDIFTYYSESGGVSPLDSSDEESDQSRDTIMNMYENSSEGEDEASIIDKLTHIAPQSVKILPDVPQSQEISTMRPQNGDKPNVKVSSPNTAVHEPLKDASHVQMTYIQPPTAQMETMTISGPTVKDSSLSSLKPTEPSMSPSSPRAIEVQRAVVPEIMQAVTQKTEEYLETTRKQSTTPRTTSIVSNQKSLPQKSLPQKPHMPQQNNPRMTNRPPQSRPNMQAYNARPPVQQQAYRPQYAHRPSPPNQQTFRPGFHSPQQQQSPRPTPQYKNTQPRQFNSSNSLSPAQSNSSLNDEWNSPPHSPGAYITSNSIKQILYSSDQCVVFHWANQSWYAADGPCLLQVRLTHNNRTCMSVELQTTCQLYLNAWILPNTVIRQPSATDVSLSVYMGTKKENYLVHLPHPQEATRLVNLLQEAHREAIQPLDLDDVEPVDNVQCPQTVNPVMQCKAKLYVQTETSKWSTLGSVSVMIAQQTPSMRMMIQIENEKTKLVSAVVRSGNVEKISSKRISFLLSDEGQKTSMVYMIQLREDQTGDKIYEYLRVKNSECGW